MAYCVLCETVVDRWQPHPDRGQSDQLARLLDVVGPDLDRHACPNCRCTDGDRHLWLYLLTLGMLNAMPTYRVMMVDPTDHLESRIRSLRPKALEVLNLERREGGKGLDISIPSHRPFELIVCNHVLERVAEPQGTVRKLLASLSRGGYLIAQTSFAPRLRNSFELIDTVSSRFARLLYGHEDYVRLFGRDIFSIFEEVGLKSGVLAHETALTEYDADQYGCNVREPLFLFQTA